MPRFAVVGWLVLACVGHELRAEEKGTAKSAERLSAAVHYLASDELEGRGVETAGINKAADYIAQQFAALGLKTDQFDGFPFQKFEITVKSELGARENNTLTLIGPPGEGKTEPQKISLELEKSFNPLAIGGSGQVAGPLVFAGYGITASDLKYDDYSGVEVKDKIVLLIRKEPQQADEKSVFNGKQPSAHAPFMRKIANASEHGAKAVLLVNDNYELQQRLTQDKKAWRTELDQLAKTREQLQSQAWKPEDEAKITEEINKLATSIAERGKRLAEGYDELVAFAGAGEDSTHRRLPVFFCSRAAIEPMVRASLGKSLAEIEEQIDKDLQPQSKELVGWSVQASAELKLVKAEIKNVMGVIEGEGPLANETIVVGAHYDHVGWGGPGSLAPWTHAIHNGADDNASGTAALLETARRLAEQTRKPRRRIVFLAFSGEERGLLGSAHYCKFPRYELENTVAMFNMDMVGRLVDNKLIVYGTGTATEFDPLVQELGKKFGFELTKHEGGFGPSDHASFYAKKIPVLHLFTGNHNDYHRPSDDADKINYEGMSRVVDFMVDVINRTDTADARPTYREIKKIEHISDGGDRPYFGSIPDYSKEDVEGLALMGAVENGPAAKAGIQAEDIIVQLGESKVTGIEDFDSALRKFKPGDRVKVKILRGKETKEVEVTLGKR